MKLRQLEHNRNYRVQAPRCNAIVTRKTALHCRSRKTLLQRNLFSISHGSRLGCGSRWCQHTYTVQIIHSIRTSKGAVRLWTLAQYIKIRYASAWNRTPRQS